MLTKSPEKFSERKIESYYLFLDTNLFYSNKVSYNIFEIILMRDLLYLRNGFNKVFSGYKAIKILIPKLVVDEIYSIKEYFIKAEISKFQNQIKHLEETELHNILKKIHDETVSHTLELAGINFFSKYGVEIIPYCNNEHLPTIIDKSIKKELPFKPKFDDKKNNRPVGDDGFKDTVIWFSIIDYVKTHCNPDMDHIFFLTTNQKDFKSDQTILEFKEQTGIDIEIIDFKSENPRTGDIEFTPFLNYILGKSHVPISVKINTINISYSELENKAEINSILAEPISVNLNSIIKCKEKFSNLGDENKKRLNEKIKDILSKFRFDISDLSFNYYIPEIENVSFVLVKYENQAIYVDDINVVYNDGSDKHMFDVNAFFEVYTNPDPYYCYPMEIEDVIEDIQSDALTKVRNYLAEKGYGSIEPESMYFEWDECYELI